MACPLALAPDFHVPPEAAIQRLASRFHGRQRGRRPRQAYVGDADQIVPVDDSASLQRRDYLKSRTGPHNGVSVCSGLALTVSGAVTASDADQQYLPWLERTIAGVHHRRGQERRPLIGPGC